MEEVVMSNNEIPVGSRWRLPGGGVWEVTRHSGGGVVHLRRCSDGFDARVLSRYFADATRIDAPPAVKVGDVVVDAALLQVGMKLRWPEGSPVFLLTEAGLHIMKRQSEPWALIVVALPEPANAEAPRTVEVHDWRCSHGAKVKDACRECYPEDPRLKPARCAPGCTPAAPCRTEGVCPVFAEEKLATGDYGFAHGFDGTASGITADLPPARRHTPPPLRHEGACIAGWNGREGRR